MAQKTKERKGFNDNHWDYTIDHLEETGQLSEADRSRIGFNTALRQLRGHMSEPWGRTEIKSIALADANDFIAHVHRHSAPVRGWKYGVSLWDEISIIGVVTVGRPVARNLDDGTTLEVTRLALLNNAPTDAASRLLGNAARIAKDLGYGRLVSYTLESETGGAYQASGWDRTERVKSAQWNRPSRQRDLLDEDDITLRQDKWRWEKAVA